MKDDKSEISTTENEVPANDTVIVDGRILLITGESTNGMHRQECFDICNRKYYFKYIEFKKTSGKARGLGSLIHLGLAHLYARMRAKQRGEDHEVYHTPYDAIKLATVYGMEVDSEKALACVSGYISKYMAEDREKEILYVEEVFEVNIGGVAKTVRPDLVYRSKINNKIYIVDHKTTGYLSKNHTVWYSMTYQMLLLQHVGVALFGNEFGGVIINYIQTGEKMLFKREGVIVCNAAYDDFIPAIIDGQKNIDEKAGKGKDAYLPTFSEHTCWTRYGICDFYQLCAHNRGEDSEKDSSLTVSDGRDTGMRMNKRGI